MTDLGAILAQLNEATQRAFPRPAPGPLSPHAAPQLGGDRSSDHPVGLRGHPIVEEEEEAKSAQQPPSAPGLPIANPHPSLFPPAPPALNPVTPLSRPVGPLAGLLGQAPPPVSPKTTADSRPAPQSTGSAPRPSPSPSPLSALFARPAPAQPSLAEMIAQAPTPVGPGSASAAFIPSPGSTPTFGNAYEEGTRRLEHGGGSRCYLPTASPRARELGSLSQVKTECPAFPILPDFTVRAIVKFDPSANRTLAYVINQAADYSLIELPPGITITEELKVFKSVWLRGKNTTITSDGPSPTFTTHGDVVFEGLTIAHTLLDSGALAVSEGYVRILNCTLTSTIVCVLTVTESAIVEVTSSDLFGSKNPVIHAEGRSFIRITGSAIHGSKTHGIFLNETATAFIENCRVFGTMGYGIGAVDSSNLHCVKCEVYENDFTGFEITSTGYAAIERCRIHDQTTSGVHVLRQGVGCLVSHCEFSKCKTAAVNITEGAAGRVVSCTLQDADGNCLAMANYYGILSIESSVLRGKGEAALACHDSGKIEATSVTIEQIDGGGVLCYDSGILVMRDCTVSNVTKWGIQVRNGRMTELINVTISGAKLSGLVVSNRATGFARSCRIQGCNVGAEFANLVNFEVTESDISSNTTGGILCENVTMTFRNCALNGNGQLGADIKGPQSEAVFDNCKVDGNPEGILVGIGASAKVVGGMISEAKVFGVGVTQGRFHAVRLTVTSTSGAAISVGGTEAVVVCESCAIQNNGNYGIQAFDGAKCNLVQCLFSNFFDIFCRTGARVKCRLCKFAQSKEGHCDVKEEARMTLTECDLSEGGHGIQVEAAVLKMKGTHIHNQPQAAVFLCEGAVLKATECAFYDNGVCGLWMLPEARAELHRCQFLRNGTLGIQAKGGELVLENCAIKSHTHVGIVCTAATTLTEVGTEYEDNPMGNVVRQ